MSSTLPATTDFPLPEAGPPDLLLIAGEHSGDEHAARIVAELKSRQPELKVACLGGVALQAAGAQLLYDLTAVSIVGFVEVVRHYNFFKTLFDRTLAWIERHPPKHICFVDYPGFNLRLAEQLCQRGLSRQGGGQIGVSYYIGPQVWAWKAKRRFKMAKWVDRLGVIFPFEVDCFKDTDLEAAFVGHPFVREDYELPFTYDSKAPVLLLPGSRTTPVGRIFPLLLDGFIHALAKDDSLRARVVYPSRQILDQLEAILGSYPKIADRVVLSSNESKQVPASAVLMSSGTMSLAVALSGIPGAIAYRLHPLSYWMGRFLVKIPYIGISNLLLNRPLHPEYIQNAANAASLGAEILAARSSERVAAAQVDALSLKDILNPDGQLSAADWLAEGLKQDLYA